jgi:hypothetical protein
LFIRATAQLRLIDRETTHYPVPVEADAQSLFTQFLLSYKLNPQTVLFLGTSNNYLGDTQTTLTQLDRTFFLKLGYAWVI